MMSERRGYRIAVASVLLLLAACRKNTSPPDHPRLTPGVILHDVTFNSTSLQRNMQYRVVLPAKIEAGQKLAVVYLLHGGGGSFRDWTNYSDVAGFAERGLVLVMPEADDSYYTNAAKKPRDRYEDYIIKDLVADAETRFPVCDRSRRAIVGVSMGGFGAIKLALRYPEMFSFAAGVSSALDVPSRPFSIKRPGQWLHHRSIFGAWNSQVQHDNDPFILARAANPERVPFLFLTCGDEEGLLPSNRQFARLLGQRHFRYEFVTGAGGHNWKQWNGRLSSVFERLFEHIHDAAPGD